MGQGYRYEGNVLSQSRRNTLPCKVQGAAAAPTGHWQVMTKRPLHTREKIKSSFHSTSISQNLVRGLWGKGNRITAGYLAEEKGK